MVLTNLFLKGIDAMTKYVPRQLVKQILSSNVTKLLGMKPSKLTIMFSDIQVNFFPYVLPHIILELFKHF